MHCTLCRQRPSRRHCPALDKEICAACCGTKRGGEVTCPPGCRYLAAAQAHPPAVVRRRQERDIAFVIAMRDGLSERQAGLFWSVLGIVAAFQADPLQKLLDDDVAAAADAVASTLETADRGVIYERRPDSLIAQRLATEFRGHMERLAAGGAAGTPRGLERDVAVALRHLEEGAREARRAEAGEPAAAVGMIGRVVRLTVRAHEEQGGRSRVQPPAPTLVRP